MMIIDRPPESMELVANSRAIRIAASAGTLVDIFDESVRRYPERPALESFGTRMTYVQLAANAAAAMTMAMAMVACFMMASARAARRWRRAARRR